MVMNSHEQSIDKSKKSKSVKNLRLIWSVGISSWCFWQNRMRGKEETLILPLLGLVQTLK